jgi:hypothetical protein
LKPSRCNSLGESASTQVGITSDYLAFSTGLSTDLVIFVRISATRERFLFRKNVVELSYSTTP